jgi:hypothetical protein
MNRIAYLHYHKSTVRKLFPLILPILLSCHKEKTVTGTSCYPLAVGDNWTYQVSDYPVTQIDTAVFQIVGMLQGNANTVYTTQTIIHGAAVDSGTITQSATGYTYYGYNGVQTFAGSGLFDGWVLNCPLQAGTSWGTEQVISSGQTLSILGRSYTNVFIIIQNEITPAGPVIDTLYVAPATGILKLYNTQLISYQLN